MGLLNFKTVIVLAVGIYFLRQYFNGGVCKSEARIDGKVVIVTGSNVGIGKETVLDLIKRGGKVYMACRSLDKAREAADDIKKATGVDDSHLIVMKLDLMSLDSVRQFAAEFKQKEKRLDILINNAGIMWVPYAETKEGYESTFGVNHLGHFLLTNLLMDELVAAAPSRVVTVSAKLYEEVDGINFEDVMLRKDYSGFTAYCQSKLANILFSWELGKRLQGKGITTYSLHPGVIWTELGRHHNIILRNVWFAVLYPFLKTMWHGAQTQVCCAVDEQLANETGKYYRDCAAEDVMPHAKDAVASKKLWDLSVQLVKLQDSEIHPLLK